MAANIKILELNYTTPDQAIADVENIIQAEITAGWTLIDVEKRQDGGNTFYHFFTKP